MLVKQLFQKTKTLCNSDDIIWTWADFSMHRRLVLVLCERRETHRGPSAGGGVSLQQPTIPDLYDPPEHPKSQSIPVARMQSTDAHTWCGPYHCQQNQRAVSRLAHKQTIDTSHLKGYRDLILRFCSPGVLWRQGFTAAVKCPSRSVTRELNHRASGRLWAGEIEKRTTACCRVRRKVEEKIGLMAHLWLSQDWVFRRWNLLFLILKCCS